jgi:hypothetical protein
MEAFHLSPLEQGLRIIIDSAMRIDCAEVRFFSLSDLRFEEPFPDPIPGLRASGREGDVMNRSPASLIMLFPTYKTARPRSEEATTVIRVPANQSTSIALVESKTKFSYQDH